MAKVILPRFGASPVDVLVKEFLVRKGIDPSDVHGYVINRSARDMPTIQLTMHFDEQPVTTEPDDRG